MTLRLTLTVGIECITFDAIPANAKGPRQLTQACFDWDEREAMAVKDVDAPAEVVESPRDDPGQLYFPWYST
jgi:hypothetical protein